VGADPPEDPEAARAAASTGAVAWMS
jgi:hypothetical protein